MDNPTIFISGTTGYIGAKLVRLLHHGGLNIRCGARIPEFLKGKVPPEVEVVRADCFDKNSLIEALTGVHMAYYLVHSLAITKGQDFEELEHQCATNFAEAASECGVQRIIYLGGLGVEDTDLSPHLRSRQKVGKILSSTGVSVVEFRASIIIGSGSLSFEMIRALCERLPFMICPRWVKSMAQPIGVWSTLDYLTSALKLETEGHKVYEIGGSEQVCYLDIMKEYCRQRGLKRAFIVVPFLTPYLSSLWLGLITPVFARIGRKLVDSLKNSTVITDLSAQQDFPEIALDDLRQTIERSLRDEDAQVRRGRWSDALTTNTTLVNWGGFRQGNKIVDSHSITIESDNPEAVFEPIRRIGGANGWYYANFLWKIRGFMDLLVGGVGLKRGRPDPQDLLVGDTVDWWRVQEYDPPSYLRLFAEMKTPGRAWLEFQVSSIAKDRYEIKQTAIFDPHGILGLMYWYALYPLHGIIFRGMLKEMGRQIQVSATSKVQS